MWRRGCPVVVKVAGWPIGSSTMLGVGVVEGACSVVNIGRGQEGLVLGNLEKPARILQRAPELTKKASWVMGMVW